jgi:hypothetical protein
LIHQHIYNQKGERLMNPSTKLRDCLQKPTATANNGQNMGGTGYQLVPYTVYVGPHYVTKHYADQEETSKHYYMGGARIASRMFTEYLPHITELPPLDDEADGPEASNPPGGTAPEQNDIVLEDLMYLLNAFDNSPGLDISGIIDAGLPVAGPRDWFPCEHTDIEIDPHDIVGDDALAFFPAYTLEQLQCGCRNEEIRIQMHLLGYRCKDFEEPYFYHSDYLQSS